MAKTKTQKEKTIQDAEITLNGAVSAVFANVQGLTVSESQDLKKKGKQAGVQMTMVKKTLLAKVFSDLKISADPKTFAGGVGVFTSAADPSTPAKVVTDFARTKDLLKVFGGMFEGKFIDTLAVKQLAALPTRHELLSRLAGALQYPIAGFVRALNGNLSNLVNVLDNIKKQKA